jgi:hypothetical protein
MWLGYASYPDTYLRPEEKAALLDCGFFSPAVPAPGALALLVTGLLPLATARLRRRWGPSHRARS